MILSPEQDRLLESALTAHTRLLAERAGIERKVARIKEELLASAVRERDVAMAKAHRAGVPVRQLAQFAMGMKGEAATRYAIEHGAMLLDAMPETVEHATSETFSVDEEGRLRITLTEANYEGYPSLEGSEAGSWLFAVIDGELHPEGDESWSSPVVQLATHNDGKLAARALAWWNGESE